MKEYYIIISFLLFSCSYTYSPHIIKHEIINSYLLKYPDFLKSEKSLYEAYDELFPKDKVLIFTDKCPLIYIGNYDSILAFHTNKYLNYNFTFVAQCTSLNDSLYNKYADV